MANSLARSSILSTMVGEDILDTQFAVMFFVVLLAIYLWRKSSELKNLLPVPWNLPVVGSLPWLIWSLIRTRLPVYEFMRRLRYTYGSVYAFNICGTVVVLLNDFQAVKTAMDSPYVSDRPQLQGIFGKLGTEKGELQIICIIGPVHKRNNYGLGISLPTRILFFFCFASTS